MTTRRGMAQGPFRPHGQVGMFDKDRFDRWFEGLTVATGALVIVLVTFVIAFWGVVIWGIVRLVQHFT